MGGVGFQQFCILVFLFFAVQFHRTILQQIREDVKGASSALPLLYAIYAVLALITVCQSVPLHTSRRSNVFWKMRIVFRLCEYSQGFHSNIPTHEAYQYCLDSVPMLCSLVILNAIHPGRIMPGKESDLPSRKERKVGGIHTKVERISRVSELTE